MNNYNIEQIRKRVYGVERVLDLAFFLGIVIAIVSAVGAIVVSQSPYTSFDAIKGNNDWQLVYKYSKNSSFNISMPFYIIQGLDKSMFVAKEAFLTLQITYILIKAPIILFGIKQVLNILQAVRIDTTPFTIKNVRSLKLLSYSIILYSLFADIIVNLACYIFVTRIFLLNLAAIHLLGVVAGILVLVAADVFRYGVCLQNELDNNSTN